MRYQGFFVFHTVGKSVGNVWGKVWGKVWGISAECVERLKFSNTINLLRGKMCGRTHRYDLVDVIE